MPARALLSPGPGTGANTAIFTVTNTGLRHGLPVEDPGSMPEPAVSAALIRILFGVIRASVPNGRWDKSSGPPV